MKNKIAILLVLSVALSAGPLTGCAKTPEDSLVKMKGTASENNYEEADNAGAEIQGINNEETDSQKASDAETGKSSGIRKLVNAPESWKSEIVDETGNLKILTDAKVEIPEADKVSAITVSQHPFDQEMIDKVTETFFPEAKFYSADSYYTRTKEEIGKDLARLKGYLAEGNLDPYGYGTDENGNYYYDLNTEIEQTEEQYAQAPESVELIEVKPQFPAETEPGSHYFYGVSINPNGEKYQYIFEDVSFLPMQISIQKIYDDSKRAESTQWGEYSLFASQKTDVTNLPTRKELKKQTKLSLEEAKMLADEKVEQLGIPDMELTEWEYGILLDEPDFEEVVGAGEDYTRTVRDTGYILHYTRNLGNIPITYTTEWGGNLENMDSDMETWGYERLDFYIASDGIDQVRFHNLYDIGETKTEQVKLKSFDEIMKIYEKMMLIQNASTLEYAKSAEYKIDRITFGYARIYEPATDSQSGILVPAWDFYGEDTTENSEEAVSQGADETNINHEQYRSYLTINAIDGSIIDRGLGY